MEAVIVTFRSSMAPEAVEAVLRDRAPQFRDLDGLVQKFYLFDEESDRTGAFYVFDSRASREEFLEGDVRGAIAEAYDTVGEIEISTYELLFPLRPAEGYPPAA